ncbi:MAG: S8 family serine peptidase [Chloroflexi bacterium]|nr:S8 family serine peptidase [Chloroflexota bacterium]
MHKYLRGQVKQLTALSLIVAAVGLLWLALSAGGDAPTAHAQTGDTPTPVPTTEQHGNSNAEDLAAALASEKKAQQYPNMDSNLNRIVEQVETGQFTAQAAAASAPFHQEQSVAVTLYITEGYADAIAAWLKDNGADPRNGGVDYIEAYIPVSLLPEASQQDGVISIRTIVPPQPAQGTVVSEGAAAHGAPAWHAAGIRGQGVKIGVIDTGFEGFRSLMGTELPAAGNVRARCYTDVGVIATDANACIDASGSKHGSAVTEALFDMAPEAEYYIANPISRGDLQNTVNWMIDQDVDIINMSLSWTWTGPGDGTSIWSFSALRVADAAVASGIVWVNSAGNAAVNTWFGAFSDTNGDGWHNFTSGDNCNAIEVQEGVSRIKAELRWDDNWRGSSKDLDLALFRTFRFVSPLRILPILVGGIDVQDGQLSDIPFEEVLYLSPPAGTYCLAVGSFDGTAPSWIQLRTSILELEHHTLSGSINEPADSANPGLLAVGAAPWSEPNVIDFYSSRGPTPDGRIKPDIVGASSITTSSYNSPFSGTSASSPHVAGLAALVKQNNPSYSPQQVANYLKSNAEARGAVPNNTWGYGFAKLPASDVAAPTPEPTPTAEPTPIPTAGTKPEPTVMPTEVPTTVPIDTPVPTPIPSVTPEPTPVVPQVPEEVLTRISALETLMATLQGLITSLQSTIAALDVRVAALETSASAPTPIPTTPPTPTTVPDAPTPTPTATLVPGAPTPTVTPTPTPEPDPCELLLPTGASPVTVTGSWIDDAECVYPAELPNAASGDRYYRWVGFKATSASVDWTATLTSNEDTYMLLWEYDDDPSVLTFIDENDDIVRGSNSNSRITWTPTQGKSYLLDLTTYNANTLGDFTLTIEAASSGTQGQSSGQSIELSDITLERRQK